MRGEGAMKNSWAIILNAVIWGAVIVGCSLKLKGTDAFQEIQTILAAGAGLSVILTGALLSARKKA